MKASRLSDWSPTSGSWLSVAGAVSLGRHGTSLFPLVILIANNVLLTLLALYFHVNRRQSNLEIVRGERRDRRVGDPPSHERRPEVRG